MISVVSFGFLSNNRKMCKGIGKRRALKGKKSHEILSFFFESLPLQYSCSSTKPKVENALTVKLQSLWKGENCVFVFAYWWVSGKTAELSKTKLNTTISRKTLQNSNGNLYKRVLQQALQNNKILLLEDLYSFQWRKYSIHSADLVLQNSNQSWEVSQTNNTAKNDLICGVLFIFLMQLMSQEGREGMQKMWISLVFYQTCNLSSSSGVIHLSSFPMLKLFTISHCLSSI